MKLFTKIGKFIPLYFKDDQLYGSIGYRIIKYDFVTKNKEQFAYYKPSSLVIHLLAFVPVARRILRLGFHTLLKYNNGLLGIVKGGIVFKPSNKNNFELVYKISRGSRPLNICLTPDNKLYWGEYFSNKDREPVHIYRSNDGINWETVYTFGQKSIRHIHGIYFDRYRKGMWVLTGDSNQESGIWFTKDNFITLNLIFGGSQRARAVSILPKEDCIIIPMDTPLEKNYIQKLIIKDNSVKVDNLAEVGGSIFNSYVDDEISMISTVIEKSQVNLKNVVEIWASKNEEDWKNIVNFKPDTLSRISEKYFRYPQLSFVEQKDSENSKIISYCQSIRGYNGYCICWNKKDILDLLEFKSIEDN
jgi:hypothetical protein